MLLNILFISDDDRFILDMIGFNIETSLENCNIGIFQAEKEIDIRQSLNHDDIHLIVADMNIDKIVVDEFYDKLQRDIKYRDFPFVFTSANAEDIEIASLKGLDNFFLKPIDVDKLLERLHDILENIQKEINKVEYNIDYFSEDDDYIDVDDIY